MRFLWQGGDKRHQIMKVGAVVRPAAFVLFICGWELEYSLAVALSASEDEDLEEYIMNDEIKDQNEYWDGGSVHDPEESWAHGKSIMDDDHQAELEYDHKNGSTNASYMEWWWTRRRRSFYWWHSDRRRTPCGGYRRRRSYSRRRRRCIGLTSKCTGWGHNYLKISGRRREEGLIEKPCKVNECYCPNGVPAGRLSRRRIYNCPIDRQTRCTQCHTGYTLTNNLCTANKCWCRNGIPKTPCPVNGMHHCERCNGLFVGDGSKCQSCKAGYYIKRADSNHDKCLPYEWVCSHGSRKVEGDRPLSAGLENCIKCQKGYQLTDQSGSETKKCVERTCKCNDANGKNGTGTQCVFDANKKQWFGCATCGQYTLLNETTNACDPKICNCPHGTATVICDKQGMTNCTGCDDSAGFELVGAVCKERQCSCSNGKPAIGKNCPITGTTICKTCDDNYHIVTNGSQQSCEANICKCPGGTGKTPCPEHNAHQCNGCLTGHHLDTTTNKCKANICTCTNGQARGNGTCTTNGAHQCHGCIDYYHLIGATLCLKNDCPCEKGTKAENCNQNLVQQCDKCDMGYYLSEKKTCAENKCICKKGNPAVGVDCPAHGKKHCSGCKNEWQGLVDGKCKDYVCQCKHGHALKRCNSNGTHCHQCNTGYHLEGSTPKSCQANVCKCTYGSSVTAEKCTSDGAEICASCNKGYKLNKTTNLCQKNMCTCTNGTAAIGGDGGSCDQDRLEKCTSCDTQHFELSNDKCKEKTCTCQNGKEDNGALCVGGQRCKQCNPGYKLIFNGCQKNICYCPNGNKVNDEDCLADGPNCQSCNALYHKEPEVTSEATTTVPAVLLESVERKSTTPEIMTVSEVRDSTTQGTETTVPAVPDDGSGNVATPSPQFCTANICGCQNGAPKGSSECSKHNGNECRECKEGFHMNGKNCEQNVCSCVNGSPNSGRNCTENGKQSCSKCETDHYYGETCQEHVCTCGLGTEKKDDCNITGESCASCDVGAHMEADSSICAANTCNCLNGASIKGVDCIRHNTENCSSCDYGYHLENGTCAENICICQGSDTPPIGVKCAKHNALQCVEATCDAYKHLVVNGTDSTCEANVCKCLDGTPKTDSCKWHHRNECSECNGGFHLLGLNCKPNKCRCGNGTPATGASCTQNNAEQCKECHDGYLKKTVNGATTCEAAICTCESGTESNASMCITYPTSRACCPKNQKKCQSCIEGYELVNGSRCENKICWCVHGNGAKGINCPNMHDMKCASCELGYSVRTGDICEANKCTCNNGVGAFGANCETNGAEKCSSCFAGYHNEGDLCQENICNCPTGIPAKGVYCPKHGGNKCTACSSQSESIVDGVCKDNPCSCEHGVPAQNCSVGERKCQEPCDKGYTLDTYTCKANMCTCEHGQPESWETTKFHVCEKKNHKQCLWCDTGYYKTEDSTCMAVQCQCRNGTPKQPCVVATGDVPGDCCSVHKKESCQECNAGYKMNDEKQICRDHVCPCENGIGMSNNVSQCPQENKQQCDSCDFGYHIVVEDDQNLCKVNTCTCNNGAIASSCSKIDGENCETCNDGYYLQHSSTGGQKCQECPIGCAICKNQTLCTECVPEWRPEGGVCVDNCTKMDSDNNSTNRVKQQTKCKEYWANLQSNGVLGESAKFVADCTRAICRDGQKSAEEFYKEWNAECHYGCTTECKAKGTEEKGSDEILFVITSQADVPFVIGLAESSAVGSECIQVANQIRLIPDALLPGINSKIGHLCVSVGTGKLLWKNAEPSHGVYCQKNVFSIRTGTDDACPSGTRRAIITSSEDIAEISKSLQAKEGAQVAQLGAYCKFDGCYWDNGKRIPKYDKNQGSSGLFRWWATDLKTNGNEIKRLCVQKDPPMFPNEVYSLCGPKKGDVGTACASSPHVLQCPKAGIRQLSVRPEIVADVQLPSKHDEDRHKVYSVKTKDHCNSRLGNLFNSKVIMFVFLHKSDCHVWVSRTADVQFEEQTWSIDEAGTITTTHRSSLELEQVYFAVTALHCKIRLGSVGAHGEVIGQVTYNSKGKCKTWVDSNSAANASSSDAPDETAWVLEDKLMEGNFVKYCDPVSGSADCTWQMGIVTQILPATVEVVAVDKGSLASNQGQDLITKTVARDKVSKIDQDGVHSDDECYYIASSGESCDSACWQGVQGTCSHRGNNKAVDGNDNFAQCDWLRRKFGIPDPHKADVGEIEENGKGCGFGFAIRPEIQSGDTSILIESGKKGHLFDFVMEPFVDLRVDDKETSCAAEARVGRTAIFRFCACSTSSLNSVRFDPGDEIYRIVSRNEIVSFQGCGPNVADFNITNDDWQWNLHRVDLQRNGFVRTRQDEHEGKRLVQLTHNANGDISVRINGRERSEMGLPLSKIENTSCISDAQPGLGWKVPLVRSRYDAEVIGSWVPQNPNCEKKFELLPIFSNPDLADDRLFIKWTFGCQSGPGSVLTDSALSGCIVCFDKEPFDLHMDAGTLYLDFKRWEPTRENRNHFNYDFMPETLSGTFKEFSVYMQVDPEGQSSLLWASLYYRDGMEMVHIDTILFMPYYVHHGSFKIGMHDRKYTVGCGADKGNFPCNIINVAVDFGRPKGLRRRVSCSEHPTCGRRHRVENADFRWELCKGPICTTDDDSVCCAKNDDPPSTYKQCTKEEECPITHATVENGFCKEKECETTCCRHITCLDWHESSSDEYGGCGRFKFLSARKAKIKCGNDCSEELCCSPGATCNDKDWECPGGGKVKYWARNEQCLDRATPECPKTEMEIDRCCTESHNNCGHDYNCPQGYENSGLECKYDTCLEAECCMKAASTSTTSAPTPSTPTQTTT